jgi:hypothetical protein
MKTGPRHSMFNHNRRGLGVRAAVKARGLSTINHNRAGLALR